MVAASAYASSPMVFNLIIGDLQLVRRVRIQLAIPPINLVADSNRV